MKKYFHKIFINSPDLIIVTMRQVFKLIILNTRYELAKIEKGEVIHILDPA